MATSAASVVVEWTVLRCRGPHPYASKLPERFAGQLHDAHIGIVPFRCRTTGHVGRDGVPPPSSMTERLLIHVRCPCGAVTEYEVMRFHAE